MKAALAGQRQPSITADKVIQQLGDRHHAPRQWVQKVMRECARACSKQTLAYGASASEPTRRDRTAPERCKPVAVLFFHGRQTDLPLITGAVDHA